MLSLMTAPWSPSSPNSNSGPHLGGGGGNHSQGPSVTRTFLNKNVMERSTAAKLKLEKYYEGVIQQNDERAQR